MINDSFNQVLHCTVILSERKVALFSLLTVFTLKVDVFITFNNVKLDREQIALKRTIS